MDARACSCRTAGARALGVAPFLVLLGGVAIAAAALPVSLSALEPFDAWIWHRRRRDHHHIALVGLAARRSSQAYSQYGCPTGSCSNTCAAVPTRPVSRRDALAAALLALAVALGYWS